MTDINVGQFSEALNDKMDRDAHNVQSPSDVVIEKQDPSAANNYTWYRKYKSGWVEQGGVYVGNSASFPTITLPVAMADTHYNIATQFYGDFANNYFYNRVNILSATTFQCGYDGDTNDPDGFYWQACGIAAN